MLFFFFFFFQAEDGIRDKLVTGVQTCALPIYPQALFALRARLLPAAPVLVAEESQCAFEGRGKITRIVGDRDAVLVREARTVRHLVGGHQIAAPDVGRVEAEAPRTEVPEAPQHE